MCERKKHVSEGTTRSKWALSCDVSRDVSCDVSCDSQTARSNYTYEPTLTPEPKNGIFSPKTECLSDYFFIA